MPGAQPPAPLGPALWYHRLDHILEHQVYGIAPTEIISQIATNYILGYDDEVGTGCAHHLVCADSAAMAKDGTLAAFVERAWGDELREAE